MIRRQLLLEEIRSNPTSPISLYRFACDRPEALYLCGNEKPPYAFVSHKHYQIPGGCGVLGLKWKFLENISEVEFLWLDVACMLQSDTPNYNYETMTRPTVERLASIMSSATQAIVLLEGSDNNGRWLETNLSNLTSSSDVLEKLIPPP